MEKNELLVKKAPSPSPYAYAYYRKQLTIKYNDNDKEKQIKHFIAIEYWSIFHEEFTNSAIFLQGPFPFPVSHFHGRPNISFTVLTGS